jgi:hypothetical protein
MADFTGHTGAEAISHGALPFLFCGPPAKGAG